MALLWLKSISDQINAAQTIILTPDTFSICLRELHTTNSFSLEILYIVFNTFKCYLIEENFTPRWSTVIYSMNYEGPTISQVLHNIIHCHFSKNNIGIGSQNQVLYIPIRIY